MNPQHTGEQTSRKSARAGYLEETPQIDSRTASPFLKWAGGKGQLLSQLTPLFPTTFGHYFEPFLGGGAVFFSLQPLSAVLSDISSELVNVYLVVRDSAEELIGQLSPHKNESEHYYRVRAQDPKTLSQLERAARLIFLNKTCYNGLYRVNRKGQFNVPFGRYANPTICDERQLGAASRALHGAEITQGDFATMLQRARQNDFIYLDPPFHPLSQTASFTSYAQDGFDEDAQRRLAQTLRNLDARGCLWLLSNSDTPFIRELYQGFAIARLEARRAINSKGDRRGAVGELAIRNYRS